MGRDSCHGPEWRQQLFGHVVDSKFVTIFYINLRLYKFDSLILLSFHLNILENSKKNERIKYIYELIIPTIMKINGHNIIREDLK